MRTTLQVGLWRRDRRITAGLARALVLGILLALLWPSPSQAAQPPVPLPGVQLPEQVDIIDRYQGQTLCDPTPKPGALALREILWRTYGRSIWASIPRDCGGGVSEHKDGRAIDWGVSVRKDTRAEGDAFAAWAVADNGANARRLGIMYIIWDSRMWRTYDMGRGWTEYQSCQSTYTAVSSDTTCHRDHMHISLTWHGAGAETSFYDGTPVLLPDCSAGSPVARTPGTPDAASVLLDPLAGIGTQKPCYLDDSIQTLKLPVPVAKGDVSQRIRVTQLSSNAPSPVKIWTNGGSRIEIAPGTAVPREYVLSMAADGIIYVQQPVGQAQVRIEGLGQAITKRLAARTVLEIPVTGAGVPADAEAVNLNMTVTQPIAAGYVTVYPCGVARPATSTLNFTAGQTVANSVVVGVGAGGKVCAYTTAPAALIADFGGYFPKGSAFAPITPQRLKDTRADGAKPPAGSDVALALPGGAAAASLTITVTQPDGPGWVSAYPCGTPFPTSSTVNFTAGQTVPNSVIAKAGTDGRVCIRTSTATHVVVDMTGSMPDGAGYTPAVPQRLTDTRIAPGAVVKAGTDVEIPLPAGASAVAMKLTVTGAGAPGWVLAYPCGTPMPLSSSVNFLPGQSVANGVIVKAGAGGRVCVRGSASTHIIADLSGSFGAGDSFYRPAVPVRLIDTRK